MLIKVIKFIINSKYLISITHIFRSATSKTASPKIMWCCLTFWFLLTRSISLGFTSGNRPGLGERESDRQDLFPTTSPREIDLVYGNHNLANSLSLYTLSAYYHPSCNGPCRGRMKNRYRAPVVVVYDPHFNNILVLFMYSDPGSPVHATPFSSLLL